MTANNVALLGNMLGVAINVGSAIYSFKRIGRAERLYTTTRERIVRAMEDLLPAVAVCMALRDDESAPEDWRAAATAAIPDNVTATVTMKGPLMPGDSRRVH